jgi:crotonobetainyl-CoA:carnitine CoA-transferase CaiB-like acyl-CoA transferase
MQVLEGIKVVDLTMWAAGPGAAAVLAHWGADVIKIEDPRRPDPIRVISGNAPPGTASVMFDHYNRGKRAISVDITRAEGRDVFHRLIENADVFVTSHLPKTRQKLRCDVDDVRAVNPRIVYAKVTGQGPRGPDAERGGFDVATFWSRGGLADTASHAAGVDEPPGMIGHGDGVAGFVLASGICAALVQRERTGTAPVVDASLLGTAMWILAPNIAGAQFAGDAESRLEDVPRRFRSPSTNVFRTKDGRYLQLVFLGGEADWLDFYERIGRPELANDPRFVNVASFGASGSQDNVAAVEALDDLFAQRTLTEWRGILADTRGVWAPVQTLQELYNDSQTRANGFIRAIDDAPDALRLVAPPVLFDEEPGDPARAPAFGEHTDEVLREVGVTDADLARYREQGVVA